MSPPVVVYDACVLYPAPLRDLLMHLAWARLVHARWTDAIHDEWIRNLLANRPDLSRAQLERTRALMERAVPEASVTGYEHRISALTLPDPDDRHVLAAAWRRGPRRSSPSTWPTSPGRRWSRTGSRRCTRTPSSSACSTPPRRG